MKGIDKTKHTMLLGALHELLDLTGDSGEVRRIEGDIAALTAAHDEYQALLERLRVVVASYDTLHADLRSRTCHAIRSLRRQRVSGSVIPLPASCATK